MLGENVITIFLFGTGMRNLKDINSERGKMSKLQNVHASSSSPCGRALKLHDLDLDLGLKRSRTVAVSINHRASAQWCRIPVANLDY